jgi:hypothetical protein
MTTSFNRSHYNILNNNFNSQSKVFDLYLQIYEDTKIDKSLHIRTPSMLSIDNKNEKRNFQSDDNWTIQTLIWAISNKENNIIRITYLFIFL